VSPLGEPVLPLKMTTNLPLIIEEAAHRLCRSHAGPIGNIRCVARAPVQHPVCRASTKLVTVLLGSKLFWYIIRHIRVSLKFNQHPNRPSCWGLLGLPVDML
jgi:hypothetical protein